MNKKVIYAALMFVVTMSSGNVSAQQLPYQNPALSAHERAVDLCGRLTLEEKASLMLDDSPAIPRLGIKRFQWWSEALHGVANMGDVTVFPEPIRLEAASYFVDVTLKHNFRMVDQCNVVTDFFHGSHVVSREDDGVSLIFQFQDFPFQQFCIDRIESGERFVEDQQLGFVAHGNDASDFKECK